MRIQNLDLMDNYLQMLTSISEKRNQKRLERLLLFYGTEIQEPSKIYKNSGVGFDLSYATSKARFGKGLYFPITSLYAHGSAYRKPGTPNTFQVLVADVFVGNTLFAVASEDHERDLNKNKQAREYDSLLDLDNFYVIYKNYQSYPLYLVEYMLEFSSGNEESARTKDVEALLSVEPEGRTRDSEEVIPPRKTNLNQLLQWKECEPNCPSLMCRKRVLLELNLIQEDKFLERNYIIESVESEHSIQWIAYLNGPEDTPYADGLFQIEITFDNNYPISPPRVQFKTMIYHPCVDEQGMIGLGLLNDWNPSFEIQHVLLVICCLLHDPTIEEPLMPEILKEYYDDIFTYKKTARIWTKKFAKLN